MYKPRRRRIYLASCFHRQDEMRALREELWRIGYEVTATWLDEPTPVKELSRGEANAIADRCYFDIERSSIFVCFLHDNVKGCRAGHQTEFGYARAKGKVLLSVGSVRRNVFHHEWRVQQFETVEDFLVAATSWKSFTSPPALLAK